MYTHAHDRNTQTKNSRYQCLANTGSYRHRILRPLIQSIKRADHTCNGTQKTQHWRQANNNAQIIKILLHTVNGPVSFRINNRLQPFTKIFVDIQSLCRQLCRITLIHTGKLTCPDNIKIIHQATKLHNKISTRKRLFII